MTICIDSAQGMKSGDAATTTFGDVSATTTPTTPTSGSADASDIPVAAANYGGSAMAAYHEIDFELEANQDERPPPLKRRRLEPRLQTRSQPQLPAAVLSHPTFLRAAAAAVATLSARATACSRARSRVSICWRASSRLWALLRGGRSRCPAVSSLFSERRRLPPSLPPPHHQTVR